MGRVRSYKPKMVPSCWQDFQALLPTQELLEQLISRGPAPLGENLIIYLTASDSNTRTSCPSSEKSLHTPQPSEETLHCNHELKLERGLGLKDVLKASRERLMWSARLPEACVRHLSGGGSPASPTWLFSIKRIFVSLTDTLGSLSQDGWALGSRWDGGASTLLREMPPQGWATQGRQAGSPGPGRRVWLGPRWAGLGLSGDFHVWLGFKDKGGTERKCSSHITPLHMILQGMAMPCLQGA